MIIPIDEVSLVVELLLALTAFTYEAQKYVAVLSTIEKYALFFRNADTQSPFMEICEQATEQQLLTLLSRMFDKAKTHNKTNCTFRTLQEECRKKNISQSVLCAIDEICNEYEQIISRDVRNKKLAHIDYETLFSRENALIDFSLLSNLVNDICETITVISNETLLAEISFPSISQIGKEIECSFPFDQIKQQLSRQ